MIFVIRVQLSYFIPNQYKEDLFDKVPSMHVPKTMKLDLILFKVRPALSCICINYQKCEGYILFDMGFFFLFTR